MSDNLLDDAWERINALGGVVGEYDDFGKGCNHGIEQALFIIEELGGKNPAARPGRTPPEQPIEHNKQDR